MSPKTILVTVGTTQFDDLVKAVLTEHFIETAVNLGFTQMIVQTGFESSLNANKDKFLGQRSFHRDIEIIVVDYIENFQKTLQISDLVISHAGAGTILESLRMKKKVIGLVNINLMNNHQQDLCSHLQSEGFILKSSLSNIAETLHLCDSWTPRELPEPNCKQFLESLSSLLKFNVARKEDKTKFEEPS